MIGSASILPAANIIHEFYVPLPEAQVRTALVSIEPASGIIGTTIESVISIVATGAGTVIHYDQWEDGYEVDLNNPTQSTTQIWGDGNNANGIAPGFANDPSELSTGAVMVLRNQIPLPRNPANLYFDGRDRFGGTKALVVTRASWATTPGTVLCGSNDLRATMDYGTQYISPVGDDVSASSMFEYVGVFVMARDDATSVAIDADGAGGGAPVNNTLNRGESYLMNGGIKKGATINSTKPVQVHLITGDIGARYESRRFTLYPRDQWSNTTYSPVGTAADGDAAFAFLYNPNAAPITINAQSCAGTTSFPVPANGVYQHQMQKSCGTKFFSIGEEVFYGIATVGANPTANNVHDWGFAMVPSAELTTEAVVGWGPGSSDLSQNGSPVWVTPISATRVYVDYNGDKNGPLTDPKGVKYDVHYDLAALETRNIYDPDKDQTAMRLYTLDGTPITAAWGQDPAVAGPGNPFLDCGTTVLPFPVPTLIKSHSLITDNAPAGLSVNDVIEYRIDVDNKGLLPLGNLLVLDPLNASLTYVAGTTKRDGNAIPDDGIGSTIFPLDEAGFVVPIIQRGGNTTFSYRCIINASGSIANTASNAGYNLVSTTNVEVPPPAGSTPCGAQFTNSSGTPQASYTAGALVYGTMTDPDANHNAGAVETIMVAVTNTSNGDSEFITLVETGVNTGIFRNTTGLPTSTTSGTSQFDGTLLVSPGNNLSFTYTDPQFNETCTGNAIISVPTQNKYLYLSDPAQALDRVDPVATSDATTAQTAVLSPPNGAITAEATSTSQSSSASSLTFAHTVGTGSNRLLLVGIAVGATTSGGNPPTVSGVTYGGVAMTSVGSQISGSGASNDDTISYIYRLIAPASGAANVVISLSGSGSISAGATTFNNVHQTTPLGSYTSNSNTSGTASVVTASAANELVFSTVAWDEGYTVTVPSTQTVLWGPVTSGPLTGAGSTKAGAASVTSTYTGSPTDQDWAISAVAIKPAIDGGGGSVSFVSSKSTSASSNSVTLTNVYTGTATNRMLLVGVNMTGTGRTVSGITYGGVALTLVSAKYHTDTNEARSELWRLINPASGTANVAVTIAGGGANNTVVGAAAFSGVHQTTPLGSAVTNEGLSTAGTLNVTATSEDVVFAMASHEGAGSYTQGSGQIELWDQGLSTVTGTSSTKAGASGSVTMTSTFNSNEKWTMIGVPIKSSTSGGASSMVSFLQAPAFASAFTMPVGATPTVTAHYTVSSGSMPGSPAITATLKKGAATLATSTGTTASAATGSGFFTFTFAALGSAVNFASSEALTLEITTTQSGASFTVDYDSMTKPSKITLPTTTVINVDSLAVYDAPYPGGSLITAPASGATAYVRSTASDPFGAYDITSMGLVIDGPGVGGDISTTLTAPNVVNTTAGAKTYEYAWSVGATVGTYNIAVTANEGTEGINATRATSVNVTFLDLGTPSTTKFTTGSNGPDTSTYAGNEQVCVRITDIDQDLDAGLAETIQATITSAIGDSELVTLTETGINTGVFVFCIPASTSAPNTPDDGTLHAVLGDVLTVDYVDPTDPTDTGADTATIPNIAPGISVTKKLVSPADGQAVIGEALQYTVKVANTGNTTLNTISLVDTFPVADLTFVNASVAPNSTTPAGTLTWNNVGPLNPGQSVTRTLNFTALSAAAPAVNTATADAGGGTTGGGTANVTITDPKISIAKTLLSPNPGPANIGDNVVFRIAVQNIGDTAIATLPIEDTYSGADFSFVSATQAPDASGSGSLLWLDVTGAGNLGVGNTITIDVTLKAKGAAAPAANNAAAEYTVDVNGDPAPPVNSTATITLIAAKITGHVYDDVDQSVTFNAGDLALQSITLSLYTDPNGDGNPADGTLVAIATTDAGGAYEFPNLPAGDYVIVESQPPGYSSSGDSVGANDNRIPLTISTLTEHAGNNFYDYATPSASYGSIAGKVWNDANASGTVNGGEVGLENVAVDLVEDSNGNGIADPGEPVVYSTLTASDGSYSFGGLSAGNYVVVEHDLFNWYSTADAAAPNNNMIPVVITSGLNVTGRDFLDVLTGTTGGKVFHDVNGNGIFDGGDVALSNIDVIITDSLSVPQTVVTNASGNWTATVPPGLTTIDVQQSDPQFTAVFVVGYSQTAGTDPGTVTIVSGVNTPGGDDGFRQVGTVTGHLYLDENGNGIQDGLEPDLADVSVVITDSGGGMQIVVTNATGDWTASVPAGNTSANVDETDTEFAALVLAGYTQTEGTDPNSFTAVVNTTVNGGTDGFFNPGSLSGTVLADTDNDDAGDIGISGVVLTLLDGSGAIIDGDSITPGVQPITATTNGSGVYIFNGLPPGTYQISEAQPSGYASIEDRDGGDLDIIGDVVARVLDPGEHETGNNFVEEQYGSISGTVWKDTDNNDSGDTAFPGVVLTLLDLSGAVIDGDGITPGVQPITATTNGSGVYTFSNVPPGDYRIGEAQPLGYQSVSDADGGNLDQIGDVTLVNVTAGVASTGNDFVEEELGAISGTVLLGITPMPNVVLALFTDPNGDGNPADGAQLGGTVLTNASGVYTFTNVAPGNYVVVQTQPAGYISVGDGDTTNPGDDAVNASQTDNRIPVGITAGELDDGNNFTEGCPTITVNPATLPNGVVGSAYNQTLTASGGTAPYSYAVTVGALPAGLTLTGDTISGTPTSSSGATFTVTATDSLGCTGARGYTVTPVCPTITVNPASLPDGVVGTAYNQTLSGSGGTAGYTYAVTTGVLPAGLSLTGNTISGTPTSTASQTFTITATDANDCAGTRSYTIAPVCPTITVNPASLPDATVGSAYNQTLSATGGTAPYSYAVTSGSLPAGITLTGASISGTSTAAGAVTFAITATDANNCTGTRSLTITSTCPTITVNPATLPNGVVGSAYSEVLSSSNGTGPYTYAVTSGTLPAGLSLTGDTISGTPTSTTAAAFTVTATDANSCTGARTFTVTPVCPTISLASTPAVLLNGTIGSAYSAIISASGGTAGYTYAVTAGSLPAGLSLSTAGAISGTPAGPAVISNFTITATDANGCTGSGVFTIGIDCNTLVVTPTTLADGTVGAAYGPVTMNAAGATGAVAWAVISGTMPAGVTLSSTTGEISGTPTGAGTSSFAIEATDANGCTGTVNLSVTMVCPTITVTPATLPDGVVGTAYAEVLSATGGTAPYTYAVTSGTLPAGLTLTGDTINGTPTSATGATFTITTTDANGCTGARTFTVTPVCPTITVNPATLPDGVVGTSYNQTLSATDGTGPYTFAVTSGGLPAGLNLTGADISGTPTSTTAATFTITATDANGCAGSRTFTITPVCPTITVSPASLPAAVVGTAYNQTLSGSGGTAPYTFVVTTGSLPAGLGLSGGVISGTPTATDSETFTITATDAHGCEGARSFTLAPACPTITVNPASLPAAVVGTSYSQVISASGGTAAYSYAVTTGSLPAGLSLVADTISGTPTSTVSETFTITTTDAHGCEGTRSFTLAPACPTISLSSTPAVLPSGTVGVAYTGAINATGGTAAYTFTVKIGNALPPGLSIDSAGSITGTPTVNATTNTIIVATDANGCTGEASFTINVGCNTLAVSPGSLTDGVVGSAYTPVTFNATGGTGAITWSHTGTLPTGMTFSSAGVLSGTPTNAGSFTVTFIATDENTCAGNVNITFSTNCPTITVNPATLTNGVVGTAYGETLSGSGGTAPYTFAVTTGALPVGLSLTGGTISGTPTSTTSQTFTITATDANGCEGTRVFIVTPVCPTVTVNPATLPDGVVGTSYNQTLSAADGTGPYTFAVTSGGLPAGLNLTGADISGTPTSTTAATFTITATDANGCAGSRTFTITPVCPTITVSPASLPAAVVGTAYNQTLSGSGGTAPYTFAVTTGSLPAGLGLSGGVISGTPTATDSETFTITATDAHGCEGARSFTLAPACPTITVNPAALADASVGAAYTATLSALGGIAPYSYAVTTGALPAGLTLTGDTLSGTPTSGGSSSFTITATDANGCTGARSLSINVLAASIGNSVWNDVNNNGLKESGENGIDGIEVELLDGSGNPIDSDPLTGGIQATTSTTAGGGFYSFGNLPAGNYSLRIATPPALHPISSTVTNTNDDGMDDDDNGSQSVAGGAITSPVFALAAGENEQTIDFGLVSAGGIGNSVWHDTNNNGLKDGGESGIDTVSVALLDSLGVPVDDPNQAGVQDYAVTTSGGGAYSFTNLVPGTYQLRITTPPAAFPMSSTTTNTNDDGQDDDDNGSQAFPGAPTTSPLITLSEGETDNTVDFGFTVVTGTLTISGQVRDDYDMDGEFSDNDQPVPSVTIKLFADGNDNDLFDPGIDVLLTTTTTDAFGNYSFGNLPDGAYIVQEIDPRGAASTADTTGINDNLIFVTLAGASSTDNDFLDAVDPAGYIYSPVTGQIIAGGAISVSGPGAITILQDGSTGQYSFVTDTAGTFTVTCSPPLGYMIDPSRPVAGVSFDPTGGPDPTVLGSGENPGAPGFLTDFSAGGNPYYLTFDLEPGDPFVINNNIPLVEIKPSTLAAWQYSNPLGGLNGPADNPDGDRFDNLQEYAFCYAPDTGVSVGCPLKVIVNADGTIDAQVRMATGLTDIIYTLEYIADLAGSGANGAGWTDVTTILPVIVDNGNGTSTATYAGIEALPGLIAGRGFVRVRVDLDANGDTVPEQTSRTLASGWDTRALTVQCQTISMPFFVCDIFSGTVDSVSNVLNVATSVGSGSLSGAFVSGKQYYLEVLSGDNAGHRFDLDEASSTTTTIAISTASGNHNTLNSVPSNLAGDVIAVRQHVSMDDVFVKSKFTATNNQTTSDRLLFFNATTGTFSEIYWLFLNGGSPKWVLTTDAGLADQGARVLNPAEAAYAHCRTSTVNLTLSGRVRQNSFACPLEIGSNLIGSGFPMDQSPAMREMTVANGFTGGRDPRLSDQIRFWAGDESTGTEAYVSHFLVEYTTLHQWSPQSNASLLNENNLLLFKSLHGAFIKSISGKSGWVLPAPWTP